MAAVPARKLERSDARLTDPRCGGIRVAVRVVADVRDDARRTEQRAANELVGKRARSTSHAAPGRTWRG